jgi:hypothetical protein
MQIINKKEVIIEASELIGKFPEIDGKITYAFYDTDRNQLKIEVES